MANTTITRASVIAKALDLDVWTSEEREVLSKMYASITKPRKASNAPTKVQLENANLAKALVKAMRDYARPVSAKWISENVPGILSPQKAVAVVKASNGQIEKFYIARDVFYRLTEDAEFAYSAE